MKNISKLFAIVSLYTLLSCGGSSGGGESAGESPVAATLTAPANNSECLSGQNVSATESKITFQWNAAANTDSYIVYVKNLNTQLNFQHNAGANTTMDITLQKGVPYSWWVTSKSDSSTETAISQKWKFYNAGDGTVNYTPFPAEAIYPLMSSTVSGPTINVKWNGSDIENDITEYKLFMDTNNNPTTLKGTTPSENLDVTVSSNATYYWKVVTKDATGNTSDSPVFQFKTF